MSKSCEERIEEHLKDRLEDIRLIWTGYQQGYEGEEYDPEETEETCPNCEGLVVEVDSTTRLCKECFEKISDLPLFCEYGLSFDYVPEGTFPDQEVGYFRWQLSWGGPSDEFRFYVDFSHKPYRIEYVFLDWFDGATRTLYGVDRDLLSDIFGFFDDIGIVQNEYDRAIEE